MDNFWETISFFLMALLFYGVSYFVQQTDLRTALIGAGGVIVGIAARHAGSLKPQQPEGPAKEQ